MSASRPGTHIETTVNGKQCVLVRGTAVADLVDAAWGRAVAVARNREVVPRDRWETTFVEPGDEIEIVRPIQGG